MQPTIPEIDFFKDLYQNAKNHMGVTFESFTRNIEQYNGSKEIDGSTESAKYVRNITYELIESQVSSNIPAPRVDAKRLTEKTTRNERAIEQLLTKLRNDLPFERLNDLDERATYIYGGSAWLIEWDESIVTHSTAGAVKISVISPENIIVQPNCYSLQDAEYCFVRVNTGKAEICRRYGIDPPLLDSAEADESIEHSDDEETVTVFICYYKDDERNICRYVWTGDVELLNDKDYYSRRRTVCALCGRREELCTCEKPKLEEISAEYEELTKDIKLQHCALIDGVLRHETVPAMIPKRKADGAVITRRQSMPAEDENGRPITDPASPFGGFLMQDQDVPVMVHNKIKYYKPRSFPIVIRKNITASKCFWGQSDCDAIRPQQQEINKIESRIQEKLIRAGVLPVLPDDAEITLNNSVFGTVVRLRPGESTAQYGRLDMQPNIAQDVTQAERLYQHAKNILGITNSYQGQHDSSAQSGIAKQAQIAQSAGRLDSKRRMKYAAYADIDRAIFELYLAFADEPRAISYRDEMGKLQNVVFSRYDFLEEDPQTGEWYYDDGYLFSVDLNGGIEQQREQLWQLNLSNLQNGTMGNPQELATLLRYWKSQEQAHYPHARENVEYFQNLISGQAAKGPTENTKEATDTDE